LQSKSAQELAILQNQIIHCRKCPRLVEWREKIAREKTKRFRDWTYWGKPNPGFGDPKAEILLVGLAPAAHGGNRTGRMFTGDRSGDWLYRALFRTGFANQPTSTDRNDGLKLRNCYITAVCRCAPPLNKLLPSEIAQCRPYLLREIQLLKNIHVVVGLGRVGFENAYRAMREVRSGEMKTGKRRPAFCHGVEYQLGDRLFLLGSYHPSQQNTFTGKLTEVMLDTVFQKTKELIR